MAVLLFNLMFWLLRIVVFKTKLLAYLHATATSYKTLAVTLKLKSMKKFLFVIVICFSNLSFSQTREETIDWLNYKFAEYTDSWYGVYSIDIKNFKGEEFMVITKKGLFNNNNHIENIYIGKKTVENVITTPEFRTDGKLGIKINAIFHFVATNGEEPKLERDAIRIYCLPAPDETIIRMKKGIILLLNSMGYNLKEPKELFKN